MNEVPWTTGGSMYPKAVVIYRRWGTFEVYRSFQLPIWLEDWDRIGNNRPLCESVGAA